MKTILRWIWLGCLPGMLLLSCAGSRPMAGRDAARGHEPPPALSGAEVDSLFVEAEIRQITGNRDQAIRLFRQFLLLRPDNATAHYELSKLYGLAHDASGALDHARRAVQEEPGNRWFSIAYAEALAMNKRFDSAAQVFHELARTDSTQMEYPLNEAVLLANAGHDERALQLLDTLEARTGLSEELVFQKQRIYVRRGDIAAAAREIRRLIAGSPGNDRYYGLLAQVYEDGHQLDKAIDVYRELLQLTPENPRAMVALGLYYKKSGQDSLFRHYMAQAFGNPQFDLDDKIAFVYPFLKYVEVDSTERPEALELCRLIVDAHPHEARAHALAGDMFYQCGMLDSARLEYRRTLALDDSRYEVWRQLMLIYIGLRQNDSLLQVSSRVVRMFPEEMTAWYFHGMASIFAGEPRTGAASLRKALSLDGGDRELRGRIYGTLGEAYHTLGDYTSSDHCFDTAVSLQPSDDLLLNNYSYYLSERGEDLDKALDMIRRAVSLKPNLAEYQDTYAWVLFRMGRYREARTWMEKALAIPDARQRPGYLEHYGDILYKLHDVDEALRYWKLAQEHGGRSELLERKIREKRYSSDQAPRSL